MRAPLALLVFVSVSLGAACGGDAPTADGAPAGLDTPMDATPEGADASEARTSGEAEAAAPPSDPTEEATGSTPDSASVARGKALFNQPLIGGQAGCMNCHKVKTEGKLVGPSLKGLGALAKTRVEGQDAEAYLIQSILEPNAHIVEGFVEGLMPLGYADELVKDGNDTHLKDLVAYLSTL